MTTSRATRTVLLLAATLAYAQTPRSADDLLKDAETQAAGQRAIFGIFHASW